MEYRILGSSGVKVSPLCLGTMNLGGPTQEAEAVQIIEHALAAGINMIDTADIYNDGESERIVGCALKANGQRNHVVLSTKVWGAVGPGPNDQGLSRYHIVRACEDSLRRLQTDRIDLYQLHRPSIDVPMEETLRALDDLVRAGKVLNIGTSTFPAWMVMEGLALSCQYGWARFCSEESPYNLLDRRIENELIPLARRHNLAILPWSPLAKGILAGRYLPGEGAAPSRAGVRERINDRACAVGARLVEMARQRGVSAAQLALLWCKDQPGVTAPVIGPRTIAQLEELLPVAHMSLAEADQSAFDSLVPPGSAVANFFDSSGWMKERIG